MKRRAFITLLGGGPSPTNRSTWHGRAAGAGGGRDPRFSLVAAVPY